MPNSILDGTGTEPELNTSVTESADRDEFAARAVERLMATGRAMGMPDNVTVETALQAVNEVQQEIVRDGAESEPRQDDGVRALLQAWFRDRDARAHAGPLDHRYDRPAREWKPSVHPEDFCNKIDCTVAPHVAPDGRAISNYGVHKTYSRVVTSDSGDVMRVSIGKAEDVCGLAERGMVFLSIVDQDAEGDDGGGSFATELTADEAEELADALKSRARALRSVERRESEAAAEEAVAAMLARKTSRTTAAGAVDDATPDAS